MLKPVNIKVLTDKEKDDAKPYLAFVNQHLLFREGILAATLGLYLNSVIVGSHTKMPYLFIPNKSRRFRL